MFNHADFADLYPFQPNYFSVQRGGKTLRMHYVDEGPRTSRRAVLMLHGNPTWSFYYRNLVLKLRGQTRCIAIDHIGCGLSEKPQDYSYRLNDHIENALALVEHLKLEEIALVVHDWGGAIGMGLATRQPERFARFVVLNTAAFRSTRIPLRIAVCRIPVLGALAVRGLNGFAGAALYMATEKGLPARVKAGLVAPYDNWANRIATLRFVEDIPMAPSHPSWKTLEAIEEKLPTLRDKPMMLGWGMKDWCFSPHFLERWIELFPKAEVHRYADAGHYVVEDAADQLLPEVERFVK
jgi:cis-3-alkyl-4-acyloxetan-2-one decarboxylase